MFAARRMDFRPVYQEIEPTLRPEANGLKQRSRPTGQGSSLSGLQEKAQFLEQLDNGVAVDFAAPPEERLIARGRGKFLNRKSRAFLPSETQKMELLETSDDDSERSKRGRTLPSLATEKVSFAVPNNGPAPSSFFQSSQRSISETTKMELPGILGNDFEHPRRVHNSLNMDAEMMDMDVEVTSFSASGDSANYFNYC